MSWRRVCLLAVVGLLVLARAAIAVMLDDTASGPARADDPYAEGVAAFEEADWPRVVELMSEVVEARPWHDDAYTRLGFAYRKLGDYERSLEAYDRALELNPHHRGALEYLGEAYLELDRPDDARRLLDRLEVACRRVMVDRAADWRADCEEWRDLAEAYEAYTARD